MKLGVTRRCCQSRPSPWAGHHSQVWADPGVPTAQWGPEGRRTLGEIDRQWSGGSMGYLFVVSASIPKRDANTTTGRMTSWPFGFLVVRGTTPVGSATSPFPITKRRCGVGTRTTALPFSVVPVAVSYRLRDTSPIRPPVRNVRPILIPAASTITTVTSSPEISSISVVGT